MGSHNGRIDGNKGNVVSNIGDNATHNTKFGHTSNVAEGGQGTFNAPVTRGNLSGNHQENFGSALGSQIQGDVNGAQHDKEHNTHHGTIIHGDLSGNHQQNSGSAKGSQVQGGVNATRITGFNGK